ncbi:Asp-tRNA(Asn)/Glu-tRNA(Gln) amidotransferase subunit GatC [Dehalobacterium formicoaceticum]|uniref:Aspartyl/glutamyl-tRNA(Asn/Gln) amidotransferase subunit C n=1 Tax=Dehalobacterium formicoaceticum TaxID=51515 RepID=A0ABT1Y4C8_9FIRM|nr:Asp-tRNA(Asn)/Glu-tRNA(Gln) amidotransferase subunit GatC [Dehalobacterium formicoaceticum]MCR6545729.1 Asp-tRNA(Asn)/Glu-tRNA(Gln) amidotransferase subunit GatC [Dehalobacterium formicoaceticum]
MITIKDVEHVALLARLELSQEEKEMYTEQLNLILNHIDKLEELDTENVPPTAHVLSLQNVLREDEVYPSLERAAVLENGPNTEKGQFKVPRIV